jgi:serine/threonine protein phosphatase 1
MLAAASFALLSAGPLNSMGNKPRILAIGDIHGCAFALETLLRAVLPTRDELIVTLGDYVDRGPDSAGVLNRLVSLATTHRLVALRGNHEQMMLAARDGGGGDLALWHACGGDATLMSYCPFDDRGTLADVPDAHWEFLDRRCVDWYETDSHFFVHGGVVPHLPLARQSPVVLRWQTFDNPQPHACGKVMVCGHTPQRDGLPTDLGHAVCIDTNAHDGGWLTCLDVTGGEYWQANERGETRGGVLGR